MLLIPQRISPLIHNQFSLLLPYSSKYSKLPGIPPPSSNEINIDPLHICDIFFPWGNKKISEKFLYNSWRIVPLYMGLKKNGFPHFLPCGNFLYIDISLALSKVCRLGT
jgi:hypothetical protein